MYRFRFLVVALVALFVALSALAALAQPTIPDPTQEQVDSARGFAAWREKVVFNQALFGLANVPKNCTRGLLDESKPPSRFNYVVTCDGPITWCDAPGVDCDAAAP